MAPDATVPPSAPRRLPGFGVRLAADVLGPADAPVVVLFPGAGQTRRAWGATARSLAGQGYRTVCVDLRGHGQSDWAADGDYSIDAFVADTLAVISQFVAPSAPVVPIVLVGASLGGIAALIAASHETSGRIAGLVLVDVVPDMEAAGLKRIRDFMSANGDGFARVEDAADAVEAFLPGRPRPASLSGLRASLRDGEDGRLRWHWDPAFHAGSAGRAAAGMLEQMGRAAAAVRVPTLLVSGRRSELVRGDGARKLLEAMPQATWVDVEGAGHMVAGDSNDAFLRAIRAFLASTSPLELPS